MVYYSNHTHQLYPDYFLQFLSIQELLLSNIQIQGKCLQHFQFYKTNHLSFKNIIPSYPKTLHYIMDSLEGLLLLALHILRMLKLHLCNLNYSYYFTNIIKCR